MTRRFENRAALIAYLRAEFPAAVAAGAHVADVRGGRPAGLERLKTINPAAYAASRNHLDGAVTRLSPYIRHGLLTLAEVRDAALAAGGGAVGKLVQELAWRDYYQRVYEQIGGGVWNDREPYKTGRAPGEYARELPEDIRSGTTGLACIDAFSRDLIETGYLHNHARMWLAGYIIHWRHVRWQAGAHWFLQHLLDGDPASNNLSWQWVASTFGHKPYFYNRENVERFSGGRYCRECPLFGRCAFEGSYPELEQRLFPGKGLGAGAGNPQSGQAHGRPRKQQPDVGRPTGRSLVWIHGDCLNPEQAALRRHPEMPAVWVWDDTVLQRRQLSLKRVLFLYESLLDLPVTILRGNVPATLAAAAGENKTNTIVTMHSVSPGFRRITETLAEGGFNVVAYEPEAFVKLKAAPDLRRFSRYWRAARPRLEAAASAG